MGRKFLWNLCHQHVCSARNCPMFSINLNFQCHSKDCNYWEYGPSNRYYRYSPIGTVFHAWAILPRDHHPHIAKHLPKITRRTCPRENAFNRAMQPNFEVNIKIDKSAINPKLMTLVVHKQFTAPQAPPSKSSHNIALTSLLVLYHCPI